MLTAKLFENEGSQAVELPQSCRFTGNEVFVSKIGDIVVLAPQNSEQNRRHCSLDSPK